MESAPRFCSRTGADIVEGYASVMFKAEMEAIERASVPAGAQRPALRRVLNAGSGPLSARAVHPAFVGDGWQEIRIDIDPEAVPNVVGSITDMASIFPAQSFEAVWSSHTLEHLYPHEVPLPCRNSGAS
jgi:hypothetical protein